MPSTKLAATGDPGLPLRFRRWCRCMRPRPVTAPREPQPGPADPGQRQQRTWGENVPIGCQAHGVRSLPSRMLASHRKSRPRIDQTTKQVAALMPSLTSGATTPITMAATPRLLQAVAIKLMRALWMVCMGALIADCVASGAGHGIPRLPDQGEAWVRPSLASCGAAAGRRRPRHRAPSRRALAYPQPLQVAGVAWVEAGRGMWPLGCQRSFRMSLAHVSRGGGSPARRPSPFTARQHHTASPCVRLREWWLPALWR